MSPNFPGFLTSPALLLQADGELVELQTRALRSGRPVVVLAREVCGFAHFRAPRGLNRGGQLRAARLQASLVNPYADTGALITRAGSDFGIWWWNAEWVREKLGTQDAGARLIPETMAMAPGEGCRVVKTSTGIEAQLWRQGFLVADVWSRRPFDAQEWEFVVHAFGSPDDAPLEPPTAAVLPLSLDSPYLKTQVFDLSLQSQLPTLAASFVTLVLCLTGFWLGEGLRLDSAAAKVDRETGQLRTISAPERQHLLNELNQLQAIRAATSGPDPLAALVDAERNLKPFGVQVLGFAATGDKLTLTLPNEAGAGLDLISDQLQASGKFYGFKPKRDPAKQQITVEMLIRPSPDRPS
jgi:hypothetical protein